MKWLLLSLCLLVTSCGTLGYVKKAFVNDPEVPATEKRAYLERVEEIQEATKQFRVYHILAVVMIAAGVGMVVIKKGDTIYGIGTAVSGFVVSGWALFAPANQVFIGWFLGALIVSSVVYLGYRLLFLRNAS